MPSSRRPWSGTRPLHAQATAGSCPRSGLLDRRVVVWLNELQGFLGPKRHRIVDGTC